VAGAECPVPDANTEGEAEPAAGADSVADAEDPVARAEGAGASASCDGRVNPGGVSGANPAVCVAADSSAATVVDLELAPESAGRVAAFDVAAAEVCEGGLEGGGEVGGVPFGVEFETAVDDCAPRFTVPRALAALKPFDASIRCANKPSKNARRGCEGAI
jgi:hypothetical protein